MMKELQFETLTLEKIVGGGQAMGTLADGRKAFVWGGLPDEQVTIEITKKKSKLAEGIVTEVLTPSPERTTPLDADSYLSTSPWQIMDFDAEQRYKAQLIGEAFALHNTTLPGEVAVYTDGKTTHYRNKVEFSWYGDTDANTGVDTLDIAFFRRGTRGKIIVDSCSLLPDSMVQLALAVRDVLRTEEISARDLKTLLIRCDQAGNCVFQLYVKSKEIEWQTVLHHISRTLGGDMFIGGEIIYSDPKSPASVVTKRMATHGKTTLTDTVLGVPFSYATEGFFQVNIPVYEQALRDMQTYVKLKRVTARGAAPAFDKISDFSKDGADALAGPAPSDLRAEGALASAGNDGSGDSKVIDLYSGVGSIGLTIGGDNVTLVEINEHAVREMRQNIQRLGKNATAVLAPSEKALEYITSDATIILDPPRVGLHADVVAKLLEAAPERIIYLSCNPTTQARDVELLASNYQITAHRGYNFFPRTPHIEHLVILDKKA